MTISFPVLKYLSDGYRLGDPRGNHPMFINCVIPEVKELLPINHAMK